MMVRCIVASRERRNISGRRLHEPPFLIDRNFRSDRPQRKPRFTPRPPTEAPRPARDGKAWKVKIYVPTPPRSGNVETKHSNIKAQFLRWCARRDSNPHDFTHCHLKAARLPIPPRALGWETGGLGLRPAGSTARM